MDKIRLENNLLALDVDEETGTLNLLDKKTGFRWEPDPWNGAAAELALQEKEGKVEVELLKCVSSIKEEKKGVVLTFSAERLGAEVTTSMQLEEGGSFVVKVEKVAFDPSRYEFSYMLYPLRSFFLETWKDDGYIIVAQGEGALIPTFKFRRHPVEWWHFDDTSRSAYSVTEVNCIRGMPWFGAMNRGSNGSGFIGIIETPDDARLQIISNYNNSDIFNAKRQRTPHRRIAVCSPKWVSSLGEVRYPRSVKYSLTSGGYVEMARKFRRYAESEGLIRTFTEKKKDRAHIDRLIGATYLLLYGGYPHNIGYEPYEFTWKQATEIVRDLHDNLKVKKVLFNLWGGYSEQPPHSYPYEERKGTREDLLEMIRVVNECGYLYAPYNDFTAMIQEAETWDPRLYIIEQRDGSIMVSRWNGLCSTLGLEEAKRDIPLIQKETGLNAVYTDCGGNLVECYDRHHPRHPLSRSQDRANRTALWKYYTTLGLVTGGEHMKYWATPYHDFFNGGSTYTSPFPSLRAPLFDLVFHECTICYHHASDEFTQFRTGDYVDKSLWCLLHGIPPFFIVHFHSYWSWREKIQEASRIVGGFAESVGYSRMDNHRYVDGDFDVQWSHFSNDAEVYINQSWCDFDLGEGWAVPARGYLLHLPGQPWKTGSYCYGIEERTVQHNNTSRKSSSNL